MKNILFLFLVALCGCTACSKSDSSNSSGNGNDDVAINGCGGSWDQSKGQITFKVDGVPVSTYNHTCSWQELVAGSPIINFTSSMHKDGRTININVQDWKTGVRALGPDIKAEAIGGYFPHYCDYQMATFQSGTVTITRFDTTARILEGTFSGVAEKDGKNYQITEGRLINCKLERF
ncbi:MAG: hypothetical protein EOP52_04060 [Sphingobacteriales bacterium]|nr:MAG: hypothetical protein EOP52_04060 [Sphingobacteriales bacterium]